MTTDMATVAALLGDGRADAAMLARMRRLVLLALRRRPAINFRSIQTRAELLAVMPCACRQRAARMLGGLLRWMSARGEVKLVTADYVDCAGGVRRGGSATWVTAPGRPPALLVAKLARRRRAAAVEAWQAQHAGGVVCADRGHPISQEA